MLKWFQPGKGEQSRKHLLAVGRGYIPQIGVQAQVLDNRQVLVQAEFLGHIADDLVQLAGVAAGIQAKDGEAAR
ncbi:MAG: hypothetical protein Q7U88_07345 [Desulfocapsaceae bacterium]|nr:hypothetical protein [Desulfocapsaceae bacterium]